MDEGALFAWVPTLTSVSRQSIFAGEPPFYFSASLATTHKEEAHWRRFWEDRDASRAEVAYICQKSQEPDERLLERVKEAARILEITPEGPRDFPGTYEEYLARCGDDHLDADVVLARARQDKKKEAAKKAAGPQTPAQDKHLKALVHRRDVAGAAPVAGEFARRGGFVLPVAQEKDRVGVAMHVEPVQRHIAGHAHRAFLAFVIDHCDAMAGVAFAHAAGFGGPLDRAAVSYTHLTLPTNREV